MLLLRCLGQVLLLALGKSDASVVLPLFVSL